MRLLRQALSKCKLVSKFVQGYLNETEVMWAATVDTNKEVMDFVRKDTLEFDLETEGDSTAKQINRLFKGLDDIIIHFRA